MLGLAACAEWTWEDFPRTPQTNQSSSLRLEGGYQGCLGTDPLGAIFIQVESLVLVTRVFLYFRDQYKFVRRYVFAETLLAGSELKMSPACTPSPPCLNASSSLLSRPPAPSGPHGPYFSTSFFDPLASPLSLSPPSPKSLFAAAGLYSSAKSYSSYTGNP